MTNRVLMIHLFFCPICTFSCSLTFVGFTIRFSTRHS
uniref:Uncharacterized protein n=1 Tax=Arundo donax TaxID=35708 RepID=A0A0A9BPH2_ARUDO